MTTPKGMASNYSATNVLDKLKFDPKFQKRMAIQETVGMDKRAVGNINRVLGQEVAAENQKVLGLERAGEQIARRKDTVEFAKKTLDFEQESFNTKISQSDASRNLRVDIATAERKLRSSSHNTRMGQLNKERNYQNSQFGIEMGLGLAGTGVSLYRSIANKRRHKEYMNQLRDLSMTYRGINYNYNYEDTEE